MAAPTNTAATTATALTVPSTVTQNVHDSGTTYTVWYSYVATSTTVVGIWGFGDLVGYSPTLTVYLGPASAPTLYLGGFFAANVPAQIPVTSGVTYYLKFTTNNATVTPASLVITATAAPTDTIAAGSLLIPDDTDGFPLSALAPDGTVRRFVTPFPAGEEGDILTNGTFLVENAGTVDLYNANMSRIAALAFTGAHVRITAERTTSTFYLGDGTTGVYTLSALGVLSSNLLPLFGATFIVRHTLAISTDAATLYYVTSALTNQPIKRWTIATDTAASDFVAGEVGYLVSAITVLSNNTVIAAYTGTTDVFIRHYSVAGATLATWTYAVKPDATLKVLTAGAIDDPTSVWAWIHLFTGDSRFINIRVADGTSISDATVTPFEGGVYVDAATATPTALFGHSQSCPFFLSRAPSAGAPTYHTRTLIERRLRRSPHQVADLKRIFVSKFQVHLQKGIGNSDAPDPQVMFRVSKDGGHTWSNERLLPAGAVGAYTTRAIAWRLGQGRDWVFEIAVSDPNVPWAIVDAYLDAALGTS